MLDKLFNAMTYDRARGLVYTIGGAWAVTHPEEADIIIAAVVALSGLAHLFLEKKGGEGE